MRAEDWDIDKSETDDETKPESWNSDIKLQDYTQVTEIKSLNILDESMVSEHVSYFSKFFRKSNY